MALRKLLVVGLSLGVLTVNASATRMAPRVSGPAQPVSSAELIQRVDAALRDAFAWLYALPPDTDAVEMGRWVRDTDATRVDPETARWTIRITRLTDTGRDIKLESEMKRLGGASTAREVAESAAAMEQLEGRISKAEAEATLEIVVAANPGELSLVGVSYEAKRSTPSVPGASVATRLEGDWMRVENRELAIDYERWSPASLIVGMGPFTTAAPRANPQRDGTMTLIARPRSAATATAPIHHLGITAQGSDDMIDRLLKETHWPALAGLLALR